MEVQIACGGREAIALAQAAADRGRPFALALVDRSLPDLDSSTLAGGLQASGTPHLVLMTQLADRANHPHDPRFVAQVHKPVRRRVLHAAVCSALRPDAAAHDPRPNTTAGLSMSLPPRARALVADDNLVNQKVAVHMLARLGFAVDIAHDGADAVAAADNTAYDVILMDCQMPHMDGFEATRRIRSSGANRRSPIIALTANALDANNKRCADAGMNECLTKPVKLGELARTLERWMKKG
jgi:CheY-like chemotaxis protein